MEKSFFFFDMQQFLGRCPIQNNDVFIDSLLIIFTPQNIYSSTFLSFSLGVSVLKNHCDFSINHLGIFMCVCLTRERENRGDGERQRPFIKNAQYRIMIFHFSSVYFLGLSVYCRLFAHKASADMHSKIFKKSKQHSNNNDDDNIQVEHTATMSKRIGMGAKTKTKEKEKQKQQTTHSTMKISR